MRIKGTKLNILLLIFNKNICTKIVATINVVSFKLINIFNDASTPFYCFDGWNYC